MAEPTNGVTYQLRERLARESFPEPMVPDTFEMLDALPRTPNGKVDRRSLPDPDWRRTADEGFVEPRTDMERRLAEVWAGVLRVDRIGAFDSFFKLGGHSLLANQLVVRSRSAFGVEVPLRSIFEAPVLAEMALVIEELILESQGSVEAGEAIEEVLVACLPEHLEGRVAIIGMSGRFPGATDLEAFWRNLRDGVDSVRTLQPRTKLRSFGVDPKLIAGDPRTCGPQRKPPRARRIRRQLLRYQSPRGGAARPAAAHVPGASPGSAGGRRLRPGPA